MLVFVDESGDPGLLLQKGSSEYFVITLLLFEDREEAFVADQRITLLKKELGFSPHSEFHFNQLRHDYRKAFLETVSPCTFFYCAAIVHKKKLTNRCFYSPGSFYQYVCSLAFETAKPYLANATVVIDGRGDWAFRNQLSTYLRKRINDSRDKQPFIQKVKIQKSHQNNLLQMVDMLCGAVARYFCNPKADSSYRDIISHREINVQIWPK